MRPTPINHEVPFPDNEFIVSKTDLKGKIVYGNALFIKLSGYTEEELLGAPHSILRHPDMPKAVFKLLWDTIQAGNEIFAYVKNLAKDGSYYWVEAQVTPSFDDNGKIMAYHSVRRKPSSKTINMIAQVYSQMLSIEGKSGVEASAKYLFDLLKQKGVSYDEFIFSLKS